MKAQLREATSCPAVPPLERLRAECEARIATHAAAGLPAAVLQGQLIRPLVAYAAAGNEADARFWDAALAVQYAHEASLLHDDVIDEAARRRGAPTVVATRGVAAALVEGDHLLTAAYRLAASTGSIEFAAIFARAVERTVAGEKLQAAGRGRALSLEAYAQVVAGKSGELLGAALAAPAVLRGAADAERFYETGRLVGVCYQMVDDLLDYCPAVDTGKAAFGDYAHRLWTWPLAFLPALEWGLEPAEITRALTTRHAGTVPLESALAHLRTVTDSTAAAVRALLPQDVIVTSLLCEWLNRAERAVTAACAGVAAATPATLPAAGRLPTSRPAPGFAPAALPADAELAAFFARNSRSFSFAAKLFPRAERARVADVYAFCRVTDDLADDESLDLAARAERLEDWLALCRRVYAGESTGLPVLDRVLHAAAAAGVPFRYVEELVAGMRMDLQHRGFESLADLRVYTHRVASVVGMWLTRLWGVRDQGVLAAAGSLGHAMQLTNILRDVGEDLARGRVYLPRDLMARYHVDEALLARMAQSGRIPARWRGLVGELMAVADAHYERALAALPALPRAVRPAVAVAALVYQGIHDEIRRNRYDNLTRRARTSPGRKLWLAARALWRLRRRTPAVPLLSARPARALVEG